MTAIIDQVVRRFCADDKGAALLEYTILLGIITVGSIVAIASVSTKIETLWVNTSTKLAAP